MRYCNLFIYKFFIVNKGERGENKVGVNIFLYIFMCLIFVNDFILFFLGFFENVFFNFLFWCVGVGVIV